MDHRVNCKCFKCINMTTKKNLFSVTNDPGALIIWAKNCGINTAADQLVIPVSRTGGRRWKCINGKSAYREAFLLMYLFSQRELSLCGTASRLYNRQRCSGCSSAGLTQCWMLFSLQVDDEPIWAEWPVRLIVHKHDIYSLTTLLSIY